MGSKSGILRILLIVCAFTFTQQVLAQGLPISTEICETCPGPDNEYLLYLPDSYNAGNSYKLIVFLHGLQQQADWNVELLRNKGLMRVVGKTDVFLPYSDDYIVFAPFTRDEYWRAEHIREIFDHVVASYPAIDPGQVFITGMSMGGKGTWDFAIRYPELVTGIVPLWSNVNVGSYDGSDSTFTICDMADVAIWTIDGASDPKFPTDDIKLDRDGSFRWGTSLVTDILKTECSSQINPINSIWTSKTHNGWDEVYGLTSGYDIYQWIDQLSKTAGELSVTGTPIVTISPGATIPSSEENWVIHGLAFDPEGENVEYNWNVTPEDPIQNFTFKATEDLLILNDPDPGSYDISLSVSDPAGNSKEVSTRINVVMNTQSLPDINAAELFSYNANVAYTKTLSDSNQVSFSTVGTDLLNIRANGNSLTNGIRFAIDDIHDFRTETRTDTGYLGLPNHNDFVATEGEYILTVSACADNFCDEPGLSRQYHVRLSQSALPVTFSEAGAFRMNDGVSIRWTTAQEYGNSHFEILRWSEEDPEKHLLARVDKKDQATGFRNYQYTDETAPKSKLYYQIRNVDYDGNYQLSDILSVGSTADVRPFWPNPAISRNEIYLASSFSIQDIRLMDMQGREIPLQRNSMNNSLTAPPPGLYIMIISSEEESRPYILQTIDN